MRAEHFVRDSSMVSSRAGAPRSACLLLLLLASAAAAEEEESRRGGSGSPYGTAGDLAEQVATYLRQLAQEKAVVSAQKVSLMGLLRFTSTFFDHKQLGGGWFQNRNVVG